MYQNPVLFPQVTNREDFTQTVSLFDDDTGELLDLVRWTLAGPGDFAGNAWTVTIGNVVTASVSAITIKDYPFGDEMLALPLVVGVGLAIDAGSPVTISDPTGLNTVTGYVTSYAPSTGAMVCQIGIAFQFEIRGHSHNWDGGFGPSSYIGSDEGTPIIQAQLGNMITNIDLGRIQIRIPAQVFSQLRHKTYSAAMTMFDGYDTRQLFLGKLPVQHGGVTLMPLPVSTSNPFGLP
jgi:hypothetical protein